MASPDETVAKKVGARLKALRVARRRTQDQVAEDAGFASGKYISEIERGCRDLPLSTLRAIAEDALGVGVDEVIRDLSDNKKRRKGASEPEPLPRAVQAMAYEVAALPADERRKVLSLIRGLLAL